jgi:hypothetical protein
MSKIAAAARYVLRPCQSTHNDYDSLPGHPHSTRANATTTATLK